MSETRVPYFPGDKTLKLNLFLLVRSDGKDTKVFVSPVNPKIGELCVPVKLEIADMLFEPPRVPVVEIVLDESLLPMIKALNESVENLQDAGIKVRLVEE